LIGFPTTWSSLAAGYVGLELAQAYRRFGSRVTIIEAGPQLAGREDFASRLRSWKRSATKGSKCVSEPESSVSGAYPGKQ